VIKRGEAAKHVSQSSTRGIHSCCGTCRSRCQDRKFVSSRFLLTRSTVRIKEEEEEEGKESTGDCSHVMDAGSRMTVQRSSEPTCMKYKKTDGREKERG
jgi:hypothetical protein